MTDGPPISAEVQSRIFDAVQAEFLAKGVDRFTIGGVARRAGVDSAVILANWRDRRVLLMDVMLARTTASRWNPDTGSVRTDLNVLADLATQISQTAHGRALFRSVLPSDRDTDLAEFRSDLWDARFRDAARVVQRAADRGQLRAGVDPDEAVRMFAAAFYYDVIFSDLPVRPQYGEHVVDIFLNGVLSTAVDRPWVDVEQLLRRPPLGEGGGATDHAVESARRAVVQMRAWADALLDPVVLYEAVRDDGGQVVDFVCRDLNRAACAEVGLTRTDLLGRTLMETLPGVESVGLLERYVECLDTTEPLVLNGFSYRHFDDDRWLDLRVTVAGPELITVTWRDVTDRFESARRDERYRKLMDYSAVPTALAEPDGRLISANQAMASMLGYDIPTLLTMQWQDVTAPETIEQEREIVADMVAGRRETYRVTKQYLHADGHRVWADLLLSCIRRSDGTMENMIAQMIDVSGYREPGASGG